MMTHIPADRQMGISVLSGMNAPYCKVLQCVVGPNQQSSDDASPTMYPFENSI